MRLPAAIPRPLRCLLGAALALLALAATAGAQEGGGAAERYKVGLYLTDLHAFDAEGGTFGASFWLWTVGPDSARAMRSMEFPNSEAVTVQLEDTIPRGPVTWSQRKVTGTFRQHWDARNYPFDRPVLEILLKEGEAQADRLLYEADAPNSGHGLREPPAGWRLRALRVATTVAEYPTSFGDPAAARPASRFNQLRATIELQRVDWAGFAKLTAPLYAGFLICLIGCFVPVNVSTFGSRVTLLVASLFAIVLNMRAASNALGTEHGLTLVDRLHVAGLIYVVVVAAVTVLVRLRLEADAVEQGALSRLDHRACHGAAALFILANLGLLLRAAIEG